MVQREYIVRYAYRRPFLKREDTSAEINCFLHEDRVGSTPLKPIERMTLESLSLALPKYLNFCQSIEDSLTEIKDHLTRLSTPFDFQWLAGDLEFRSRREGSVYFIDAKKEDSVRIFSDDKRLATLVSEIRVLPKEGKSVYQMGYSIVVPEQRDYPFSRRTEHRKHLEFEAAELIINIKRGLYRQIAPEEYAKLPRIIHGVF